MFVAFDSDWRTNDKVQHAMSELARILAGVGADVHIIDIPAADDGSKQGIDDFLVAAGRDDFAGLIDTATPSDEFAAENPLPVRSVADPHELADGYLASLAPDGSPDRLRFWQAGFWQYTGTHYQEVPDAEIKARLADWTRTELDRRLTDMAACGRDPKPVNVSTRLVADVRQALSGRCLLPASVEMPSWVDGASGPAPGNVIPLDNGLLDVAAGAMLPHTPAYFAPTAVPYAYDPTAPIPQAWLRFLDSVWPTDPDAVGTLQEWFGYLLTADTSQQKILFLVGPKRSGKGTLRRLPGRRDDGRGGRTVRRLDGLRPPAQAAIPGGWVDRPQARRSRPDSGPGRRRGEDPNGLWPPTRTGRRPSTASTWA